MSLGTQALWLKILYLTDYIEAPAKDFSLPLEMTTKPESPWIKTNRRVPRYNPTGKRKTPAVN